MTDRKETFETVEMEYIVLEAEDVITESGQETNPSGDLLG